MYDIYFNEVVLNSCQQQTFTCANHHLLTNTSQFIISEMDKVG